MPFLCVFENKLTNPIIVRAVTGQFQWDANIPAGGSAAADPANNQGLVEGDRMILVFDGLTPSHMVTFLKVKIDKAMTFKIKPNVIEVIPPLNP
ncbi:MAG TPA: hypothetical protein VE988_18090 [Gemmataceae bacterium]|nr:hypothetical protein [Gemmataceae bacterium]